MVPIPGTTRLDRLDENVAAAALVLDADDLREIGSALASVAVHGDRYPPHLQRLIDR